MNDVALTRADLAAADLPPYQGLSLGQITLVDTPALAQEALVDLMSGPAIGFDTESRPTFRKGEESTGPHLVQLASERRAYLFPIERSTDISALKTILESAVLKVGFGLGNDRSALKQRLDIAIAHVFDLGEALRGPGHRGTVGAKVAVAHFFGEKLQKSKKIGTSNWANPRLSERQILYAANDAHVALRVYAAWLATSKAPLAVS